MLIHYLEGRYESFSNSARKSVDVFCREREFVSFQFDVKTPDFAKCDCLVSVDINSFMTPINLDCVNCPFDSCDGFYPLDVIVDIGKSFDVEEVILFVDCESTRLVSAYGKRAHLRYCVDSNLQNNQYFDGKTAVDKTHVFLNEKYVPAYIALNGILTNLFGVDLYNKVLTSFETMEHQKYGPLF